MNLVYSKPYVVNGMQNGNEVHDEVVRHLASLLETAAESGGTRAETIDMFSGKYSEEVIGDIFDRFPEEWWHYESHVIDPVKDAILSGKCSTIEEVSARTHLTSEEVSTCLDDIKLFNPVAAQQLMEMLSA